MQSFNEELVYSVSFVTKHVSKTLYTKETNSQTKMMNIDRMMAISQPKNPATAEQIKYKKR